MRILITGGAGFIGSHLADHLIVKGEHEVFVVDDLTTGRKDNVNDQVTLYSHSIEYESLVELLFEEIKPDVVIHAAASYKDPNNWIADSETNVVGTVNVVKNALKHKVERLIYLQTSLCYGPPKECPITVEHPINPQNSYAISKTAAEQYIAMSGLDYVSFRLCNIYGPRNLSGPIPTFFQRLTQGKRCFVADTRRDFVYIDDLVAVLSKAIDGQGGCGVYHFSSGADRTIAEVFNEICLALNRTDAAYLRPRGSDDVQTIMLDSMAAYADFDISGFTPFRTGIQQAVEWYKQNPVQQTYTHLKMDK
jgi:UDP-glucose 4-epimerase